MLQMTMGKIAVTVLIAVSCVSLSASEVCINATDYADLPLHDAWVTATNLNNGKVFNTRTGTRGDACISGLPEGLYAVEVGLAGFLNVRYYPVRISAVAAQRLTFRLPFGEINEGGLAQEAIISGTLRWGGSVAGGAKICAFPADKDLPISCTTTNDLGEYAVALPPGFYSVEVDLPTGISQRFKLEIPTSGIYRDRIVLKASQTNPH